MTAYETMTAWILGAVQAWGASPVPIDERPRVDEIRQRVADDIAAVAYDADEPPVFQGEHGRARTALLLVSLGGEETRFKEHILEGHCKLGECDHGFATGMLQVHLGPYGLRLLGPRAAQCGAKSVDCWTKDDLVNDWSMQVVTGLHVYRTQGPRAFTMWQKASIDAASWYVKNPPPVADDDVMREKLATR